MKYTKEQREKIEEIIKFYSEIETWGGEDTSIDFDFDKIIEELELLSPEE